MMRDDNEKGMAPLSQVRGVVPARQARSEATFQALVEAGRRFIETRTFDQMTIGDIAEAAGSSVGSFYARFQDKETFFAVIQERAMAQVEASLQEFLDSPQAAVSDDAAFLDGLAAFWVDIYRTNRGLYRASFKHFSTRPDAWAPFKRTGWNAASLLYRKLQPRFAKAGRALVEQDLRVALQFANGMLINAVINNPGPVSIDDPQMKTYVARLLGNFLGMTVPKPARALAGKSKHLKGRRT